MGGAPESSAFEALGGQADSPDPPTAIGTRQPPDRAAAVLEKDGSPMHGATAREGMQGFQTDHRVTAVEGAESGYIDKAQEEQSGDG